VGLVFPATDYSVAIEIGPLVIKWYGIAYVVGLIAGWQYVRRLAGTRRIVLNVEVVDDVLLWIVLGVILGGRLGYVLFYQFDYFTQDPIRIFYVWNGGMSFHGGLIGVALAIALFARRREIRILSVTDAVAPAFPFGLMLGRLANFINGELYGRPTDVPWAIVFPGGGDVPRHPSQLYEAALEGVFLFALMLWLAHVGNAHRRVGLLSGTFLVGYAFARVVCESFRQPDAHIGFLWSGITMGQMLSVPLAAVGFWLIVHAKRSE
tara:strand:- start:540 stop:1331 length:792 start_codon:yes stop_codon:yes gene_type:complete